MVLTPWRGPERQDEDKMKAETPRVG